MAPSYKWWVGRGPQASYEADFSRGSTVLHPLERSLRLPLDLSVDRMLPNPPSIFGFQTYFPTSLELLHLV